MAHKVCFNDPTGELHDGMPTYNWKAAPRNLATRRELAKMGLRKNGQDPVAQMLRYRVARPPLVAYLYEVSKAAPRRPWTPAKQAAVEKAAASRRRCRSCGGQLDYIPRDYTCWPCTDDPTRADRIDLDQPVRL